MKYEYWDCGPVIMAPFVATQKVVLCHQAGVSSKNVTLGVPRLKELINVSNKLKSPSLTIFLRDEVLEKDKEVEGHQHISETIKNKIEFKILRDLVENTKITKSKISSKSSDLRKTKNSPTHDTEDAYFTEIFNKIPDPFQPKLSEYSLRLEFSSKLLEYTQITMLDILDKIGTQTNLDDSIFVQLNDDNAEKPTMRVYVPIWDTEDTMEDYEVVDFLKKIEVDLLNKIHLQGLPGINKVFISEKTQDVWDPEKGFSKKKIKFIETEGTNLLKSFSIPEIDHKKTISNNIIETYNILGIEAARKALLNELRLVLSFDGSYVNYRHLAILTDIMTYRGILMSMTRHGINRIETGTLMKCSFEETVEILTESAAYSQRDVIKGVSENIMLGQLAPFGTGMFDVMLNEELIDKYSELIRHLRESQAPERFTTIDGRGNVIYSKEPTHSVSHADDVVKMYNEMLEIKSSKDYFIPSSPKYAKKLSFEPIDFIPSEPSYASLIAV